MTAVGRSDRPGVSHCIIIGTSIRASICASIRATIRDSFPIWPDPIYG
jgi:hypothetical protein